MAQSPKPARDTNATPGKREAQKGGESPRPPGAAGKPGRANPLSREELAMWRHQRRDLLRSLGPEEKKAHNQAWRREINGLSPEALAELKRALRAEWEALPLARRQKLQAKFSD